MNRRELADSVAAQVRERILRDGGYCQYGCTQRCGCPGARWEIEPRPWCTRVMADGTVRAL